MALGRGWCVPLGAVAALACAVGSFGYRSSHWTQCGTCWSRIESAEIGVGFLHSRWPLWRKSVVRASRALDRGLVPPHAHARAPGHGGGHVTGGLLAGGEIGCGEALPSEFALAYDEDAGFAAFVDAGVADGSVARDLVASLVAVPDRRAQRRAAWGRDEAKRALLQRGAAILGAFRGVPAREVRLWGDDPFEEPPPGAAADACPGTREPAGVGQR